MDAFCKFCKIHGKKPEPCNFIKKKTPTDSYSFPVNMTEYLSTPILKNLYEGLLELYLSKFKH